MRKLGFKPPVSSILIVAIMVSIFLSPLHADFMKDQLKYPRVRAAKAEKGEGIRNLFGEKGIASPPAEIFIRIFKLDRTVELWARSEKMDAFRLVKSWEICALSGHAGPKRRVGDRQIPEGFYYIDNFNPVSSFHLSLGINYPNQSDRILGVAGHLGGDIFIHGSCVTIGCVPITNDGIKELYLIAVEAKAKGQSRIPVHIFPTRMNSGKYRSLISGAKDSKLRTFWENLQQGFALFEKEHKLPHVRVDAKTGRYIFQI
jgi:murein L,D-transpeptidase YafK